MTNTYDSYVENVGMALRRLRRNAGHTAQDIALATGKSRSYVAGVEGSKIRPADDFLRACETFFGVPSGSLSTEGRAALEVPAVTTMLQVVRNVEAPNGRKQAGTTRPKEIKDADGIRNVLGSMLAAEPRRISGEKIVLATLRRTTPSSGDRMLPDWLAPLLAGALDRGWEIEHLLRLDLTREHIRTDIEHMVALLGCEGRYEPFTVDSMTECAFDVLAVPSGGVLLFGAEQGYFHPEVGDGRDEDILFEHARSIRRSAQPLFRRYRHRVEKEASARYHRIAALQAEPGEAFVVTDRLSTFARPQVYWQHDEIRRPRPYSDWLEGKLAVARAFEEDVRRNPYREIVSLPSLECFVKTGRFLDVSRDELPVAPRNVALVLSRIRELLLSPEHDYDLRLEADPAQTGITQNSWIYKQARSGACVFVYAKSKRHSSMHIEVAYGELVKHFRLQFELAWARLEQLGASRVSTIDWLERQLATLPTV